MKTLLPTSGFILSLSLFLLLSPGQGLRCYECTNDDEGCFIERAPWYLKGEPQQIPDRYIVECAPGAVSCIQFEAYYDYLFGDFLHRSCFYESDYGPLGVHSKPSKSFALSVPWSWHYPDGIRWWISSRSENGLPPPVLAKRKLPDQMAQQSAYRNVPEDLSNGGNPLNLKSHVRGTDEPDPIDVSCFSCDVNKGLDYDYQIDHWKGSNDPVFLPDCAGRSVQCKGAFGCVAFWELRRSSEHNEKKLSRVWRDCWYPGEMKCLRKPEGLGRSSSKGKDGASCKKKFKERSSRQSTETTVWDGMHRLETLKEYLAFLDCVGKIRARTGKEFNWSIKQLSDIKDLPQNETGGIFSKVRYYFCSPNNHCAGGREEPPSTTTLPPTRPQPTKPQPTTTKPTTTEGVTSTRTTAKPSGGVNPTVSEGGGSGGDEGETWEDCTDERKNGVMLLFSGAYLVPGLFFGYLIHLKLLL